MRFFGRRPVVQVRLHHANMPQSLEGFLVGEWAGHYILRVPKIVESEDNTYPLASREVRVPREHVTFYEVIS